MKKTYYSLVSELVSSIHPNFVPQLIFRKFKSILSPVRWIYISTKGATATNLLVTLNENSLPFISILDNSGLWFLDLTKSYASFIRKVGQTSDEIYSQPSPEGKIYYNYHIFGSYKLSLFMFNEFTVAELKQLKDKMDLDFHFELSSLERGKKHLGSTFRLRLVNEGFILKDVYLCHKTYDDEGRITINFLLSFDKLLGDIQNIMPVDIILPRETSGTVLRTASDVMGYFEKDVLSRICSELGIDCSAIKRIKDPLDKLSEIKRMMRRISMG